MRDGRLLLHARWDRVALVPATRDTFRTPGFPARFVRARGGRVVALAVRLGPTGEILFRRR